MSLSYGYARGEIAPKEHPVAAASADIKRGDMLVLSSGYVAQASAGDAIFGFALEDAASPSTNGGTTVLVDVGPAGLYRYPLDSGTPVVGDNGKTADVGGAQSVDITSPSNNDLTVVSVDTVSGTVLVRRNS